MADPVIPTEALEAAARALFEHGRVPEDEPWDEIQEWDRDSYRDAIRAVAPHLIAEGRRQRDLELFANSIEPDEPVQDEAPALAARLEREVRAKVAAEIRAADTSDWCKSAWPHEIKECRERAARIAEGTDHGQG